MIHAKITREYSGDEGTFGRLVASGFQCFTAELPWRKNLSNRSCIPVGSYRVIPHYSSKFGLVYWLQGTAPRSFIYIHNGNFAGDKNKGWKAETYGCILVGATIGELWDSASNRYQKAVTNSKVTRKNLEAHFAWKPFMLEITNG